MANLSIEKTVVGKPLSRPNPKHGVFSVINGAEAGRVLSLGNENGFTFGRAEECSFRFEDAGLSRTHARLMLLANDYVFQDLASTNGSYINGMRLDPSKPRALRDGDRVQLGSSLSLRFQLVDEAEEKAMRRVYDAASRDGLTGIFNRKHLDERLDNEITFALRHQTAFSIIMFDVDHFKHVNDTYTHPAGDAILRMTAGVFTSGIRSEDFVGRYGGEEFIVALRGIEVRGAIAVADRLRLAISRTPVTFNQHVISVTASGGVAALTCCGDNMDRATLIGIADQRLYQAKQAGRNRIVGPA